MYHLFTETTTFNSSIELSFDIHIQEKEIDAHGFDRTTILKLVDNEDRTIIIKIDWCNFSAVETPLETLIISETSNLFFGARFFWGIIDLKNLRVVRQDNCMAFWNFERLANTIIVITELEALALNLEGEVFHNVPIDPPFEYTSFEDRIEFSSSIFGKQILKLNLG